MRCRTNSAVSAGGASSAATIHCHSGSVTRGGEASRRQQSSHPLRQGQFPCAAIVTSERSRTSSWITANGREAPDLRVGRRWNEAASYRGSCLVLSSHARFLRQ